MCPPPSDDEPEDDSLARAPTLERPGFNGDESDCMMLRRGECGGDEACNVGDVGGEDSGRGAKPCEGC